MKIKIFYDKAFHKKLIDLSESSRKEDKIMYAEIVRTIELLEHFGNNLEEPYSKTFKNYKYEGCVLKELRIITLAQYRIFYFIYKGKTGILLYSAIKKSQKLNSNIIDLAYKKMKRYINLIKKGEINI
ncbi:MAG: type II toxin-antitoxin system RelE/ParE family toxin [Athalassotoga sp.]|uniref:type II toxin-antitoxin system RelE/ParE family toxin n=1 Tax=Athalassotoga sp. TaxID=2022597 RepID=UPI003CFEEC19